MKSLYTQFFLISMFILLGSPAISQAMTVNELTSKIMEKGLDTGIETGLSEGMPLGDIIESAMSTNEYNSKTILVSMCIAGTNGSDLRTSAMDRGISPIIFSAAMDACTSNINDEDTQAYTRAQAVITARSKPISVDPPPEPYASPSTF